LRQCVIELIEANGKLLDWFRTVKIQDNVVCFM